MPTEQEIEAFLSGQTLPPTGKSERQDLVPPAAPPAGPLVSDPQLSSRIQAAERADVEEAIAEHPLYRKKFPYASDVDSYPADPPEVTDSGGGSSLLWVCGFLFLALLGVTVGLIFVLLPASSDGKTIPGLADQYEEVMVDFILAVAATRESNAKMIDKGDLESLTAMRDLTQETFADNYKSFLNRTGEIDGKYLTEKAFSDNPKDIARFERSVAEGLRRAVGK